MPMTDVTICVTSFLRPGYAEKSVADIEKNFPECQLVVVDDSQRVPEYTTFDDCMNGHGLTTVHLPFDSGLSAKRNAGVKATRTKYWLNGCDDFDMSTAEARAGVEKLVKVMDEHDDIDVAGGRVDNNPYEFYIEYKPGEFIREHVAKIHPMAVYVNVDLTVNYFLGRTDVMKQFPWPEEMKIGGEHVCFFLDMKQAGRKVVYVPGVNVNTFTLAFTPENIDPRYPQFRARARDLGHALMKKRYNIKDYIGGDGAKS
jgi:glycosyltransferase involved in cell wall biosynthesis